MFVNGTVHQECYDSRGAGRRFQEQFRSFFKYKGIRIVPGRQHQDMGICIFFPKHILPSEIYMLLPEGVDTPLGGPNPGIIRIINQNHAAGKTG